MKEKLVLLLCVFVGLFAFALTHKYIRSKEQELADRRRELESGAQLVEVVAAARNLNKGATIELEDIGRMKEFRMSVLDGHIKPDEFRMILGKKLRYPIDEGKPIFWSHIDMPYRPRGGLAPTINRGMRAVSISVGGEAGVSGLVKPSDRVDMLGTFSFPSKTVPGDWELVTLTILQNVTVLATGQELARGAGAGRDQYRRASRGYSSVTVELTPEEAELIVFASRMKGSLTLTLRNPTDVSHIQPENLKSVDFNHLEKKIPEYHTERRNRQLSPRRRSP